MYTRKIFPRWISSVRRRHCLCLYRSIRHIILLHKVLPSQPRSLTLFVYISTRAHAHTPARIRAAGKYYKTLIWYIPRVLFISLGSRIPSVLKLNWIPPGPFAATAVVVGFEWRRGGVCMGRCVVRARKLFSAAVLKNYAGRARGAVCCRLRWIYIYKHILGIRRVCAYVCTMCIYIYIYMYYLLLRFYDNCREENRKRAAGRGWLYGRGRKVWTIRKQSGACTVLILEIRINLRAVETLRLYNII